MLRWIIGIGLVSVVVIALVWVGQSGQQSVDATTARAGTITSFIEERAITTLPRTYQITMPIDGRILPIDLIEGDRVQAGETIATIEPADLETVVAQAQARVDRLNAQVIENNDSRLERSMLEGINSELVALDRAVEAAEAQTESSEARDQYFATRLERVKSAFSEGAAEQDELDQAELDHIQSRIDYRTDVLTLRALEAIRKAAQVGPRIVSQFIEKKSLSEAVLQRQIAEAEAALDLARRNLKRGDITAPCDGVVLNRAVSNQRVLPAGQLLIEIGRLEELQIEAELLSQEVVDVRVGDRVDIFGPAIGRSPVAGRVTRIEPRGFTKISSLGVEQQRVNVIVAFENGVLDQLNGDLDHHPRVGVDYRVRVRIHTDEADDAIIIPRTALFRAIDNEWQVFIIRNGEAELTSVEVGLMNDLEVQIMSGINDGDQVILAPETNLEDGTRVKPRNMNGE